MNRRYLPCFAGLVLLVSGLGASQAQPRAEKDRRLIDELRACTRRYPKVLCDEIAERAIDLFNRGDKEMLTPLMDLGLKSDGFLAEMLGSFFWRESPV